MTPLGLFVHFHCGRCSPGRLLSSSSPRSLSFHLSPCRLSWLYRSRPSLKPPPVSSDGKFHCSVPLFPSHALNLNCRSVIFLLTWVHFESWVRNQNDKEPVSVNENTLIILSVGINQCFFPPHCFTKTSGNTHATRAEGRFRGFV